MITLTLADSAGSGGEPLRPDQPVRVLVAGHNGRPLRVWLVTPLGQTAWTRRTTPPDSRPFAVEFSVGRDMPSGGLRVLVTSDLRRGQIHTPQAGLRIGFVGRAPTRPIWRYRQRISVRADGRGLQQLRVSALVPRPVPFKLSVHPPPPPPDPGSPISTDDVYGNRWNHATLDARQLDAAGVMPGDDGEPPKRAREVESREIDLISFSVGACDTALEADLRAAVLSDEVAVLPAHYQRYLLPEPHVESDAPEVLALAARVPDARQDGPLATARAAWKVTRSHLRYVLQRDEYGALYAAQNKVGDCTEYAALFVALCRARGLPARVAAGCFGDEPDPAHAVAEIWLNGVWFGMDPTNHAAFVVGLPASFVPMMRANWMTSDRAYQPWTATFLTRDREPPHMVFSEKFTRIDVDELQPLPVPPFRVRLPGEPQPAASPEVRPPDVGGDRLAVHRAAPTISVQRAVDRVVVMVVNGTSTTWRLQVVAAVEPAAPLVFAVREISVAPDHARRIELADPGAIPDLMAARGLLVAALAGEQLVAVHRECAPLP